MCFQATEDVDVDLPDGRTLGLKKGDTVVVSLALMHRDPLVSRNALLLAVRKVRVVR